MIRRALPIAALVAVAGVCVFLSYHALARGPGKADPWRQAVATAHRADRTKAPLEAMRVRDRAITGFLEISRSGPVETRSRAAMLAGLLRISNAAVDSSGSEALLAQAAAQLEHAIRLDRENDDAAYDLELLLTRAKQAGKPIKQPGAKGARRGHGKPGTSASGTGY